MTILRNSINFNKTAKNSITKSFFLTSILIYYVTVITIYKLNTFSLPLFLFDQVSILLVYSIFQVVNFSFHCFDFLKIIPLCYNTKKSLHYRTLTLFLTSLSLPFSYWNYLNIRFIFINSLYKNWYLAMYSVFYYKVITCNIFSLTKVISVFHARSKHQLILLICHLKQLILHFGDFIFLNYQYYKLFVHNIEFHGHYFLISSLI